MGLDKNSYKGNMKFQEYQPKPWEECDVDIRISHCGICGSDIHTLRSGWGPTMYPVVVGHEIVGTAVKVGSRAEGGIKVGDRVGVGAQSGSCLRGDCEECESNQEQHCQIDMITTYNGKWPNGAKTHGGYGDYWRGHSHFVIKIPDAISSESAAPMLCGGITAFNPLVKNGAGPRTKVGIIGIGGLGHFGILGAKALGCERIVAISRRSSKKKDAFAMGATDFIATDEDQNWAKQHSNSLDLIVSTVSSPKMPLVQYLRLLRVSGKFIQVGAPEDKIPAFSAFALIAKGAMMGGSSIGSPQDIRDMLEVFAQKGVRTWSNNVPMSQANKAIVDMDEGRARYRYVLINEKHVRKL